MGKLQVGVNDLATTHPDLAKEALFDPTTVTAGSNKRLPWRCAAGHEWDALVNNRSKGSGCPICSFKLVCAGVNDLATTHPELAQEALFDPSKYVAGSQAKLPWRCGLGHEWIATPSNRSRLGRGCPYCSGQKVMPGFNDLATTRPDLASEAMFDATSVTSNSNQKMPWRCTNGHEWQAPPSDRSAGNGCPVCRNLVVVPGVNDIATTHPDLAAEAVTDPTTFVAGSASIRVKWCCPEGHQYSASPHNRLKGNACPVCSGRKVLVGFNDLATTDPDVAREALFDPTTITRGSGKRMPWRCHSGHEYEAPVARRATQGSGCPSCAESGFNPSKPSWLYLLRHEGMLLLQFGITNVPDQRLGFHSKGGWEVVDVRGPMDGVLVAEWERSFKRLARVKELTMGKALGQKFFSGYTEAWPIHEYEVQSVRELMEAVEQAENDGLL